jgi:hypothetical protein
VGRPSRGILKIDLARNSTVVGEHAYLVLRESDRKLVSGRFFDMFMRHAMMNGRSRVESGLVDRRGPVAQLVRAHA